MAAKLGGVFLTCALGPVNYAGACIQGSKMPQGIQELAPEGLWGGVQRGIDQTAKLAGVHPRDVESLLPIGELRACLQRVAHAQHAALQAWGVYAGQLGGLLQGIADLTVDGRAPDASECLARLAGKVRRDRPFSEPLQALSDEIGRWQELLARCRALLDDGGALARAYQRRRLRNALAIGLSIGLVIAGAAVLLIIRAARARVEAALAIPDPCAVELLPPGAADRGSSDQRRRVTERLAACADLRAKAAREAEEKRRAEERAREEQRRREERDARCEALASRLAEGRLSPEDEAVAGGGAELLRRIVDKKVTPRDLSPESPSLPCDGARGGDRVRAAFADAAVATVWTWVASVDPSDTTREVLRARADELPIRARVMIGMRAIDGSKRAIRAGDQESLARAARLCAFGDALRAPLGQPCDAVKEMLGPKP